MGEKKAWRSEFFPRASGVISLSLFFIVVSKTKTTGIQQGGNRLSEVKNNSKGKVVSGDYCFHKLMIIIISNYLFFCQLCKQLNLTSYGMISTLIYIILLHFEYMDRCVAFHIALRLSKHNPSSDCVNETSIVKISLT